jgi:hypothetical protein
MCEEKRTVMQTYQKRKPCGTIFCTCLEYNKLLVFRLLVGVIMCKRRRVTYSKFKKILPVTNYAFTTASTHHKNKVRAKINFRK